MRDFSARHRYPRPVVMDEIDAERQQPQRVPRVPVVLSPIPWGQKDRSLGLALCQHVADATPPIVLRFNPLADARVRRFLAALRLPL